MYRVGGYVRGKTREAKELKVDYFGVGKCVEVRVGVCLEVCVEVCVRNVSIDSHP